MSEKPQVDFFLTHTVCWLIDCWVGIASFQPKSKGTYTVEVTQDGKAVPGSPFKISIDDHHVTSGQKVKVAGHIKDAMANQFNDVTVNIAEAGACRDISK